MMYGYAKSPFLNRSFKAMRYLIVKTAGDFVEVKNTVIGASSCFRL